MTRQSPVETKLDPDPSEEYVKQVLQTDWLLRRYGMRPIEARTGDLGLPYDPTHLLEHKGGQ